MMTNEIRQKPKLDYHIISHKNPKKVDRIETEVESLSPEQRQDWKNLIDGAKLKLGRRKKLWNFAAQ